LAGQGQSPVLAALAMHGLALLLGPLVFGASLAAISFVTSVSFGLIDEPVWVSRFVLRSLLPFVFMSRCSACSIGRAQQAGKGWHAAFGGVMAALGFAGLQELFTLYIATWFKVNAVVYGAFSAIPVFLVWLYASWSVILVGALIVAELPQSTRP
jgi:membrane protein